MQRLFYIVNASVQILGVCVLSTLYIMWREELLIVDHISFPDFFATAVYILLGWQFFMATFFYMIPIFAESNQPLELIVVLAYPTIMLILAFDMGGYLATPVQNWAEILIAILSGTYFLSSLIESISSQNQR